MSTIALMATVQGVQGPIEAEQLGLTLIHEHFFSSDEAVTAQWPHVRDRRTEHRLAVESAESVKRHGVKTVVEPTAMLLGRDIRASIQLAAETGLQIVACTGIYTYDHLPQFLLNRDEDFIAGLFIHDIEQGIQGTEARAAFVKCAADAAGVNERVEKVHRAAARASLRTGVPIMAHSRPASSTGPQQVEILLEEGVPPEKIQIAHTGDTDDLDYIERLLEQGVYIGMDRYGLDIFLPTEQRNTMIHRFGQGSGRTGGSGAATQILQATWWVAHRDNHRSPCAVRSLSRQSVHPEIVMLNGAKRRGDVGRLQQPRTAGCSLCWLGRGAHGPRPG